jgi:aspartyl-tRNA(Asn)/glutamyl-tRNA(Gln) amidotransferase subunit C
VHLQPEDQSKSELTFENILKLSLNTYAGFEYNPFMRITQDQVKQVAKLANLPITSEEEEIYAEQLSNILEYVEQLNSVDTTNVEPTFNVTGQSNIMRQDEVSESLRQEDAVGNAANSKDGFFVTKGVFEEE